MKVVMKHLLSITLFLFSLSCFAAVYMQTDKNGTVTYSDTPEKNAKPITLPNSNNISVPPKSAAAIVDSQAPVSPSATGSSVQASNTKTYTTFMMTEPTDQETFQNQRDIPVKL